MLINEKELSSSVKHKGVEDTAQWLLEGLKNKDLKPEDFSFKHLFENLVTDSNGNVTGYDIIRDMQRSGGRPVHISENMATSISTGTVSNLIGQILYSAILEAYNLPEFSVSKLFGVIQSPMLTVQEKFPRISNLGDVLEVVGEAQEVPIANLSEDWINAPYQQKKGVRLGITREAMITDRTGQLLEHARALGEAAGLSREIEACDALIAHDGASGRVNYNSRGTAYAPWQTSATAEPYYDNVTASNALLNQKNIDACYQTLAAIKDPLTGQPLMDPSVFTLLVTPENRYTAGQIEFSERIWNAPAGAFTNIAGGASVVPFRTVVSKYLAVRLAAAGEATSNYYFGDFSRALKFVRAMDIMVEEANPMSGINFTHDLLMQFRVLKIETACWVQPRVVTKATVS